MKKIVISLLFCLGALSFSYAQIKPSFGLKAGLNFNSLSDAEFEPVVDEDPINFDNNVGFHVGLGVHIPIKKYGILAEALFSQEGSDDFDIAYINLPVMFTYKIIPGLRAQLGPQFKIKVNVSADFDGIDTSIEESLEDDIEDLNFDGVAGLEYKFPVIGVFVQARYTFGLSDVGDVFEEKQKSFQLSVGYRF